MIKQELQWTPFITLFLRELRRFYKVLVQTVFTPMINSTLYLMIFGVGLGQAIKLENGLSYMAFLIPGLVMMGCLNNSFQNSASSIISSKFGGDLEDYRVSPLSNQQIIWAMSLGGLVRGALVGLVTLLVGQAFYFWEEGMFLAIVHPFYLILFLALGGLAFAYLGISVAFWAKSFDQLSAVTSFVLTPLIYLGGVFFSLDHLNAFWHWVSRANPLIYIINGVRYGILGVSDVEITTAVTVSFATLIIFYLIALRSLRKASFMRW